MNSSVFSSFQPAPLRKKTKHNNKTLAAPIIDYTPPHPSSACFFPLFFIYQPNLLKVLIQAVVNFMFPILAVHFIVHRSHSLIHTLAESAAAAAAASGGVAAAGAGAAAVAASAVPQWLSTFAGKETVQVWGPTLFGLATIPLFPLLDKPFEQAIEASFDFIWPVNKKQGGEKVE
jgi:hypothetical protein